MYYRDSTAKKAALLRLSGVALNLKDGTVEIVTEGPRKEVHELVNWCWKGPEGAKEVGIINNLVEKRKVENVKVDFGPATGEFGQEFKNGGKKK